MQSTAIAKPPASTKSQLFLLFAMLLPVVDLGMMCTWRPGAVKADVESIVDAIESPGQTDRNIRRAIEHLENTSGTAPVDYDTFINAAAGLVWRSDLHSWLREREAARRPATQPNQ